MNRFSCNDLLEQVGRHTLVAQIEGLGLDDLGQRLDGNGGRPYRDAIYWD